MRRGSPVTFAPAEAPPLERVLAYASADEIVAILAPLATEARVARLERVLAERLVSVTVLMDSPYDPHNGAALVRTLDAFGVQDAHVIAREVPFRISSSVTRGAHKWVDVHVHNQVDEAVQTVREDGFELIATHPEGELAPADLATIAKPCLVFGNERDGIGDAMRKACKRAVRVPMRGFSESLNVSVTAAILLARTTEGRTGDLPAGRRSWLLARGLLMSIPNAARVLRARGVFPEGFDPVAEWLASEGDDEARA